MVMLGDNPDTPRGTWPVGKISELIASSDGVIRTARVTLPDGREYRRAINMLYLLEADGESEEEELPELNQPQAKEQEKMEERPVPAPRRMTTRSMAKKTSIASTILASMTLACWIASAQAQNYTDEFTRLQTNYGAFRYWTQGAWRRAVNEKGLVGWPSGMGCIMSRNGEYQARITFKLWTAFDHPPRAQGDLNQTALGNLYRWARIQWHDKLIHHGFHQRHQARQNHRNTTIPLTNHQTLIVVAPPSQERAVSMALSAPSIGTTAAANETQKTKPKSLWAEVLSQLELEPWISVQRRDKRCAGLVLGVINLGIEAYLFHRINKLEEQIGKLRTGSEFTARLADGLRHEAEERQTAMAKAMMLTAMDDTLRSLTEMLQRGKLPPELLSSEGKEKIIGTTLQKANITRWTYSLFPTALSQFGRVDMENRNQAWYSSEQPQLRVLLSLPVLKSEQGHPLCGIFLRNMKHLGVPYGPHSLMKLDVPEEVVIYPDRVVGFASSACRHRTVEIDVCDESRKETSWPLDGYCLTNDTKAHPWTRTDTGCHWEMVTQGHKQCLSGYAKQTAVGDWLVHTNCKELIVQSSGTNKTTHLTGNWTRIRVQLKDNETATLGEIKLKNTQLIRVCGKSGSHRAADRPATTGEHERNR